MSVQIRVRVDLQCEEIEGNSRFLDVAFVRIAIAVVIRVVRAAVAGPVLDRKDERGEPEIGQYESEWLNVASGGMEEGRQNDKGVSDESEDGLRWKRIR